MNELISVIVPIYKVENYLEKCVNSIINQTYKNLEIILVDDGSPDNCPKICDDLSKKDKRIKVIHKKNGGLSDARNAGIEVAKGKYLSFIDSDDYIDSDMLEYLLTELKNNNADVSICGKYVNYENGNEEKNNDSKEKVVMDKREALIKINSFCGFDMSTCDKLYKKYLFDDVRFPYGKKCEDFYTMYKIFDKCEEKIVYNADAKYHYFQRAGSISRNTVMDEAYIQASLSQIEFFEKKYPDILYAAKGMHAFANIATYNRYIKYNIPCPKENIRRFKKAVKSNLKNILKNKAISKAKKIQAIIFATSIKLYTYIYKRKKMS